MGVVNQVLLLSRRLTPEIIQGLGLSVLMGSWRLACLLQDVVAAGR